MHRGVSWRSLCRSSYCSRPPLSPEGPGRGISAAAQTRSGAKTLAVSDYAVNVISRLAVDPILDQAMHVGLEAGKPVVEFTGELQVADDVVVDAQVLRRDD